MRHLPQPSCHCICACHHVFLTQPSPPSPSPAGVTAPRAGPAAQVLTVAAVAGAAEPAMVSTMLKWGLVDRGDPQPPEPVVVQGLRVSGCAWLCVCVCGGGVCDASLF